MLTAAVIIVNIVAAAMVTVITAAIAVAMTVTCIVVAVVFGASVKIGSGDLIVREGA